MSTTELITMLGRWETGDGPLYQQLSRSLRRVLESGSIRPGSALPPERRLAEVLSVSRNTVSAAYSQLRQEGWVDSRRGSATRVIGADYSAVAAHKANGLFATLLREYRDVLDLTVAVPDAAPSVSELLGDSSRLVSEHLLAGHGYFPHGYPPLRSALAERLTANGLPTSVDQLIVTSGAQQAISLAMTGFVTAGDQVAVEQYTFPGALDALAVRGARPLPVGLGESGVDVGHLEHLLALHSPSLAYLIPTFHNPTGSVVAGPQRRHLARVLRERGTMTIDDLTLAELDYLEPAPPPLAALEPDAPIISIGSMSKVFWGGLRIGWLRAHPNIVDRLAGLKAFADMGTSAPTQELAVHLLERYDDTREWRKRQIARSLDAVLESVGNHLPGWTWQDPQGGPHLWLCLPEPGAVGFSHLALRHGLAVIPGSLLAASTSGEDQHIRLPLYRSPEELAAAVKALAATWRAWSAGRGAA